jgi:hypothetical protein
LFLIIAVYVTNISCPFSWTVVSVIIISFFLLVITQ